MAAQKWTKGLGGASAAIGLLVLVAVAAPGGPEVDEPPGGSQSSGNANRAPARAGSWQGMGLTQINQASGSASNCAAASYGKVKQFFGRKPCRSLRRMLYALRDGKGNTVVVSVAWVQMASSGDAGELKNLADANGSGNVQPLPESSAGVPDVKFTGKNYASRRDGNLVVIAEAESAKGRFAAAYLDDVASVAARLPRP
jgi:hypothetical protein